MEQFVEPVSAPGNYKDEAKIAAYVHDKTIEKMSKAALDPALCRIVALGWQREEKDMPTVMVAPDESSWPGANWANCATRTVSAAGFGGS